MSRGRESVDLGSYIGEQRESRTVTGVEWIRESSGPRQVLVISCVCGGTTKAQPSRWRKGMPRCGSCHGTGLAGAVARFSQHVGSTIAGLRVLAAFDAIRERVGQRIPTLKLQCQAYGHEFNRRAHDLFGRSISGCPVCAGRSPSSLARAEVVALRKPKPAASAETKAEEYTPEVCNCQWHNGVQRYVCNRHDAVAEIQRRMDNRMGAL